jgi:predicted acyl esterase
MYKTFAAIVLLALLVIPIQTSGSRKSPATGLELVEVSTHFIDVAPGSSSEGTPVRLAATLYQPRFLPVAAAAIYIHGWGGRRLTGEDNLAYYIAAAGYVVLSYTARGFGGGESGGRVTLAGPDEMDDLSKVIDWLDDDPDNVIAPLVTRIGVIGGSYGGGHSFQIANHPKVSAVVPLVGWTDLEQALFPNGAINYHLGIGEFYSGLQRETGGPPFFNYTRLQFDLFDAAADGRAPDQSTIEALAARSVAAPGPDGRLVLKPDRQPRAPVFIIQSWDDYLFPSTQVLDIYSQITAPKQIYLGRRGHPPAGNTFEGEELYIGTQILRWFGRYLQGIGGKDSRSITSATAPLPAAPVAVRQFPPDDATTIKFYFKAAGSLSAKKKGPDQQQTAGGIFRPERLRSSQEGAVIPTREDMLSGHAESVAAWPLRLEYTSPAFVRDTEVMGSSAFSFFVSSSTSRDVDLIVRSFEVGPDGTEREVTIGVIRVSQLVPGEVREVTFRDFGDDWIFRAGHRLKIKISNIDFPQFRPPGSNDNTPSEITVHIGKHFPSKVVLTVRTN